MATPIITDPGLILTDAETHTVDYIDYLGKPGGWINLPNVYCEKLTYAMNGYSMAQLNYEMGESVVQAGHSAFAHADPINLRGKFIRVTVPQATARGDIVWVGHVRNDEIEREGVKNVLGTNYLIGRTQQIEAVGLEYFLDRKQIDSAVVRVTGKNPNYLRVQRPLTFNGGPTAAFDFGTTVRGNRSQTAGDAGVFDFTDSPEAAPLWNAEQIIKHLLKYHTMQNATGNPAPCPITLNAADVASGFLAGIYPVLRSEHITIFEALNEICAAQRGLAWWVEYAEPAGVPAAEIRIQSAATSPVTLPGGGTLPANTTQITLDFDSEVDVSRVTTTSIGHRDYHQVVARGARMTSTCTVAIEDHTLIEDWSQLTGAGDWGTEKKYLEGAKGDQDYSGLSDDKKKKRNDAMRKGEAFNRVFSAFRIPSGWDGKTGDGSLGGTRNWTFPVLSANGSITGSLNWNVAGLRMQTKLRLKKGWDYSTPNNPKSNNGTSSVAELAAPFAIFKVSLTPDRYQLCNLMSRTDFGTTGSPVSTNIATSYHLQMQQNVPGLRLTANGGMQHAMAKNSQWDGHEPSGSEPEVDYKAMRTTVCLEADAYCEGKYPADAAMPANTPLEVLIIEVGEKYRLDFLADRTIVSIHNGQPIYANGPAVLRDDRKYCEDIARLAYQWYQLDRSTLDVTFRQVRNLFGLGMLVTTIGAGSTQKNINTMVSKITYDLKIGTMQIETADKTLDVRSLNNKNRKT